MTQLYRSTMSIDQKSKFIAEHGVEAFMALPEAPPRKFLNVKSLAELVPDQVKRDFIAERGPRAWDDFVARANRPW